MYCCQTHDSAGRKEGRAYSKTEICPDKSERRRRRESVFPPDKRSDHPDESLRERRKVPRPGRLWSISPGVCGAMWILVAAFAAQLLLLGGVVAGKNGTNLN